MGTVRRRVQLLTRPAGLQYLARSLLARPKPGPVVSADVSGFDLAQQPVRALIRGEPLICEPDVTVRVAAKPTPGAHTATPEPTLGDPDHDPVLERALQQAKRPMAKAG